MTANETPDPETARELLWRHNLPEDVIDGALALFAQELAGKIRAHRDHTRGAVQATKVMDFAADLISPEHWARTAPAVVSSPPAADRATVLREAADDLATAFGDPTAKHIGILAASYLRRRAREAEVAPTTEAQPEAEPETPLEKRLRFSERRNDELRTECLRRGKTVAERGEKIRELEKQLDEVRSQLGAEILRAGQAEAELRRPAAEAPAPETQTAPEAEDPARIDRLRPEFFEHASVEAIDSQIRRAQTQRRAWVDREQTLGILRQARVKQMELGEWPAGGAGGVADETAEGEATS